MSAVAMLIHFHIGLVAANARGLRLYRIIGILIGVIAMNANPAIALMDQVAKLRKELSVKLSVRYFKNLLNMKKLDF